MSNLKKELDALMLLDGKEFDSKLDEIYAQYQSEEDKKTIRQFVSTGLDSAENELKEIQEDLTMKMQLEEISKFVNLSYIAEHYFNRSRSWLVQRINGNTVMGKPRYLNESEKQTLNMALQDMANKLGSLTVY